MTTKIRISAHDLEIETRGYKNIARINRVCKWCQISLGIENSENKIEKYIETSTSSRVKYIEDENHVLFQCDLYHDPRKNS